MEKRRRRPPGVTLVAAGVFLLGVGYFLQLGQALSRIDVYNQYSLPFPVWYPPLSGAVWGGLCVALGIGLWLEKKSARRTAVFAIPALLAAWLADWLVFSRSGIAIQSFGFDLTVRVVLAAAAEAILLWVAYRDRSAQGTKTGTGDERFP